MHLEKTTGWIKEVSTSKPYKCEYCGASFTREKTLSVHMCEKKRRHLQKGEKHVQIGYYAFTRFYKLSAGSKKEKSYEEFCDSPYYNAFVKFGSWLNNVGPMYVDRYIDWVVTSGVKLDHWCRDELYEKYVNELVLKESMETAVERSIDTMMSWGEEKEAPWIGRIPGEFRPDSGPIGANRKRRQSGNRHGPPIRSNPG